MENIIESNVDYCKSSCDSYDPYEGCPGYCSDYCSMDEYCPSLECEDDESDEDANTDDEE